MSTFSSILAIMCLLTIAFFIWKKLDPTITVKDCLKSLYDLFFTPAPEPEQQNTVTVNPTYNPIYAQYHGHYRNFSTITQNGLKPLEDKYNLVVHKDAQKIFCADVNDRVQLNGGSVTFAYEVTRKAPMYGGGMQEDTEIDVDEMARLLAGNIQHNLRGGYYFQGNIDVWEIGKNRIKIEIHGINRQNQNPGGYQI